MRTMMTTDNNDTARYIAMERKYYELLGQMGDEERADMLKLRSIMESKVDSEKLFFYLVQVKLCAFYGYDENNEPYWWFKKYPDFKGEPTI